MSLAFSNSEHRDLGFGFLPFETRVSPTHLAGGILPNKVILKDDINKSAIPQDGIRRNGLKARDFRWTWRDFLHREIEILARGCCKNSSLGDPWGEGGYLWTSVL